MAELLSGLVVVVTFSFRLQQNAFVTDSACYWHVLSRLSMKCTHQTFILLQSLFISNIYVCPYVMCDVITITFLSFLLLFSYLFVSVALVSRVLYFKKNFIENVYVILSCSSMVRVCSWCNGSSDRSFMGWTIELFLIPASAPRLAVVCVILSVGWCI